MKPSKYITAETSEYAMVRESNDPSYDRICLLHHSARIRWTSGNKDEHVVPSEIHLCVGGITFVYKIEE